MHSTDEYTVEIGKDRGAYKIKFRGTNSAQAWGIYNGYLVHSGYKKRLKQDGKVVARVITGKYS